MCGIACILGEKSESFERNAYKLLCHRGPDDKGCYSDDSISLIQTRLSIIELSQAGHQPMVSSCGKYVIAYNGEIYNHLQLRDKYLKNFPFKGHSDTETIIELFRLMQEKMLPELVGMWSILIWDIPGKKLFISRDRFGQKPLYYRQDGSRYLFASEIKPLIADGEQQPYEHAALVEFLALGNYGHLGCRTFFKNIRQFPQGYYGWLKYGNNDIEFHKYWELPNIRLKDKRPFDEGLKKELHDRIVEAVLSQTLSDVPIGVTLSGGIDSSAIVGILATYYDKEINVFTAQSVGSSYDETKYLNAVIEKYPALKVHRHDLKHLSIREDLDKYLTIQEEPFGDPSIIAHGGLMRAAAENGIKVVMGGQGADELFFGYTNMLPAVLLRQFRKLDIGTAITNIKELGESRSFLYRTLLLSVLPGFERQLRSRSRHKRRDVLDAHLTDVKEEDPFRLPNYGDFYSVWKESVYGIHLPHLVHYDDRNAMAFSIEGRMPFLDHRIAECVANIRPEDLLKDGFRKHPLREACAQYLPAIVKGRKDKIGFYTPLIDAIYKDADWISKKLKEFVWIKNDVKATLLQKIAYKNLNINDALLVWRFLITFCWKQQFNISG